MKKKILALSLAMIIVSVQILCVCANGTSDFQIDSNGVLIKYTGVGGDVVIPDGVKKIGNGAFFQCSGLIKITIPNGVTSIGEEAFGKCTGLTSIIMPSSLTSIGEEAFWACENLTSIHIPANTIIQDYVFDSCSGLISITVDVNNKNYMSVNGVLFSKDGKTLLVYPDGKQGDYTIPDGVETIGAWSFDKCRGLTSVNIPNSVTTISNKAFIFSGITSIVLPNSVHSIGDCAFLGCKGLTSIIIPNSVTSIGDNAFEFSKNLAHVVLSESVTSIGYETFDKCPSLTSIVIPESVTSISDTFYATDNATIYGKIGSYAQTFAQQQSNIKFAPLINVIVNGNKLILIQPPIIQNDHTLVPLRDIFEALGATVNWDGATQTVTAIKDNITITLQIGSNEMDIDGTVTTLSVPTQILNDITMVPTRAIAEALTATVNWDDSSKTVEITQ